MDYFNNGNKEHPSRDAPIMRTSFERQSFVSTEVVETHYEAVVVEKEVASEKQPSVDTESMESGKHLEGREPKEEFGGDSSEDLRLSEEPVEEADVSSGHVEEVSMLSDVANAVRDGSGITRSMAGDESIRITQYKSTEVITLEEQDEENVPFQPTREEDTSQNLAGKSGHHGTPSGDVEMQEKKIEQNACHVQPYEDVQCEEEGKHSKEDAHHEQSEDVMLEKEVEHAKKDSNHGTAQMEANAKSPGKPKEEEAEKMDTTEVKDEEQPKTPTTPEESRTLRTRSRRAKVEPKTEEVLKTATTTTGRRGRKRKVTEEAEPDATPVKIPKTPKTPKGRGRQSHVKVKLSYTDYVPHEVGDRVLSCGEGDQLGHPGRSTTKKPRRVDMIEDMGLQIVQVVAGGIHSALLTVDGDIYMCGINEQGTVPAEGVEAEGSTDKFSKVELSTEIKSQGKIVMLAAGASFTAALTDKGSVVVWGNLRDTSGEINVHPLLTKMKDHPVVLIHHTKRVIVKIAAGENHLVMLEEDGKVLTFGDGKMGQLGRSKRTGSIRPQYMVDEDGRSLILSLQDKKRKDIPVKDIHAGGFWTMLITDDQVFTFGLNNFEQLGLPIEGDPPVDSTEEDKRELRILTPEVATAYLGRTWTHVDGVQHIIARDSEGEVFGIGKNTDNALGLGTWKGNDDSEHWKYSTLERIKFPRESGTVIGTTAKLGCSLAWTDKGDAYAWGCDTSGQLGLGLKDDDEKIVATPRKITSTHLDGYKIISASISDNHCLFLARKA